jgi:hypothetical protein
VPQCGDGAARQCGCPAPLIRVSLPPAPEGVWAEAGHAAQASEASRHVESESESVASFLGLFLDTRVFFLFSRIADLCCLLDSKTSENGCVLLVPFAYCHKKKLISYSLLPRTLVLDEYLPVNVKKLDLLRTKTMKYRSLPQNSGSNRSTPAPQTSPPDS